MTHYAYYKDNQFRIISDGLMPEKSGKAGFAHNSNGGRWLSFREEQRYTEALQHAKDQSVLAEDQRHIKQLLHDHPDNKFVGGPLEDTIYPFEFDGTIEVVDSMSEGWVPTYNNPDNSGCEQPAEPIKVARLIPSKPKEEKENTIVDMQKFGQIEKEFGDVSTPEKPDNKPNFEKIANDMFPEYYGDHFFPGNAQSNLRNRERQFGAVSGMEKLYSDIYLPKVREMERFKSLFDQAAKQCISLSDENQELRDKIKTMEEENQNIANRAFVAGRSQTSWEMFLEEENKKN